jgi:NAD(P)-dependent dehydrogenase (short-subunit alcohol dehydrogenase family)
MGRTISTKHGIAEEAKNVSAQPAVDEANLMENSDFARRVAIVTGAWRGLGRAAAARLHERGASVAVNVRDRERAEALAKEIGERAFAVPGDIAADRVPDEIARRTLERFGRIDILVNNAALPLSTRFPDLTVEEWRRAIEVNLKRSLSRYDRYRADARTCLGRVARTSRRELSRAAPRHRARSRRFDLLRRLRSRRLHYRRVARH